MANSIKEQLLLFIKERHPTSQASLLTGSYVDNTIHQFSDLDLILFTKDRNELYNETVPYGKLKIQTFIIPLQSIEERLYADYIRRKCHFISMISKGIILDDKDGFLRDLIQHCKIIQKQGPLRVGTEDLQKQRINLTNFINKLSNPNVSKDNLILDIGNLANALTKYKLDFGGCWLGDGLHRMRFLEQYFPKFTRDFIHCFKKATSNQDFQPLIQLANGVLDKSGDAIQYYPKSNHFLTIHENYLCIRVFISPSNEIKTDLAYLYEILNEIRLEDREIQFYFFKTKFGDYDEGSVNVFCALHGSQEKIKYVSEKLLSSGLSENIIFPFFLNPKYSFSSEKLYERCLPTFVSISDIILNKKEYILSVDFQLKKGIACLQYISNSWFEDSNGSNSFLLYLFRCWLPMSYDIKEMVRLESLLISRTETLNQFAIQFETDKVDLLNIVNNHMEIVSDIKMLEKTSDIIKILTDFPAYKSYLIPKNDKVHNLSIYAFLKEYSFRVLGALLMDYSLYSYIPFVLLKLNKAFSLKDLQQQ